MNHYAINNLQLDFFKGPQRLGDVAFAIEFNQRLMLPGSALSGRIQLPKQGFMSWTQIQREAVRLLDQRGFGSVYLGEEDGRAILNEISEDTKIARKVVALLKRRGSIVGAQAGIVAAN